MPISGNFKDNIKILNEINPMQFSIAFDANHQLLPKKTSCISNFFNWFIHIITFTLVPLNSKLDRVAHDILEETNRIENNEITDDQKKLLTTAIENLKTIIFRNGAAKKEKNYLLETIKKVVNLRVVEDLGKQEKEQAVVMNPHIPQQEDEEKNKEVPLKADPLEIQQPINLLNAQKNEKLKKLLIELKNKKVHDNCIAGELSKILLEIDGSVELSKEEILTLNMGIASLDKAWIDQNAKKLHPFILKFVLEKHFQNLIEGWPLNSPFVSFLFDSLQTPPINSENLLVFLKSFPFYDKPLLEGNYFERFDAFKIVEGRYMHFNVTLRRFLSSFNEQTVRVLKENIDDQDLSLFIRSLYSHIACTKSYKENDILLLKALDLVDYFGPDYRQTILKALCQGTDVPLLVQVLHKSKPEEKIFETILQNYPLDEKYTRFFDKFIREFFYYKEELEPFLQGVVEYIFKNGTEPCQKILFELLSTLQIAIYIDYIPSKILVERPQYTLIDIVKDADKNLVEEKRTKVFSAVAKALEQKYGKELVKEINDVDFYAPLLPYFTFESQSGLLSDVLTKIMVYNNLKDYNNFLEEAKKLELPVWENAGKNLDNIGIHKMDRFLKVISTEHRTALFKGQIKNKGFIRNFFGTFKNNVIADQLVWIKSLNSELFKSNELIDINPELWIHFFIYLVNIDPNEKDEKFKEKQKELLIASTINLFNSPNFTHVKKNIFEALNPSQIALLPMEQYKPEICLLLACETNKLDLKAYPFLKDKIAQLTEEKERNFLKFFNPIYNNEQVLLDLIAFLKQLDPEPPLLRLCMRNDLK